MCLICNRMMAAIADEGKAWTELSAVRAAEAYLDGMAKTAEFFRQVEIFDHLGGSQNDLVASGIAALDALRKAGQLYAEASGLARRFGEDAAVHAEAARKELRDAEVINVAIDDSRAVIEKDGAAGAYSRMEGHAIAAAAILAGAVGSIPKSGTAEAISVFGKVMAEITKGALFGYAASQRYP